MKKTLIFGLTILTLLVSACDNHTTSHEETSTAAGSAVATGPENAPLVDSAKMVIDDANRWVEKGIRNEATRNEVNTALKPIMAKYHNITARLSPADTMILNQYRVDGVNKLINLQIQLDSQKK